MAPVSSVMRIAYVARLELAVTSSARAVRVPVVTALV
jgi:hypothetical protein